MTERAVKDQGVSIWLAWEMFSVSKSCYRYVCKTNPDNQRILRWLRCLTDEYRIWGFDLCFLYLRDVKRFGWNQNYSYRELAINLRIKPRKYLLRKKSQALTIPSRINEM